MTTEPATALAKAATNLRAAARTHKRSELFHRHEARRLMSQHAELVSACEQLGIAFVIDGTDPEEESKP